MYRSNLILARAFSAGQQTLMNGRIHSMLIIARFMLMTKDKDANLAIIER